MFQFCCFLCVFSLGFIIIYFYSRMCFLLPLSIIILLYLYTYMVLYQPRLTPTFRFCECSFLSVLWFHSDFKSNLICDQNIDSYFILFFCCSVVFYFLCMLSLCIYLVGIEICLKYAYEWQIG